MADYVVSESIDVLTLTETWFGTATDQLTVNELVSAGYAVKHIPSKSARRGGGIGTLYKSRVVAMVVKSETTDIYTHFENMNFTINIVKFTVIYFLLYIVPVIIS